MITKFRHEPSEEDLEIAAELHELADRLAAGDVSEIVIVANIRADSSYMRVAKFDDAWKALGALEYARNAVHKGME